jgi:hypothetical protein
MSDFLMQLAHRALAPQPTLRPRVQSLFEPPHPHAPVVREEPAELPAEPPRVPGPAPLPESSAPADERPAIQPPDHLAESSAPEEPPPLSRVAAPPPAVRRDTPAPPPAKPEPAQNRFPPREPSRPREPRQHRPWSAEKTPPSDERPLRPPVGPAEGLSEERHVQTSPEREAPAPRPKPAGPDLSPAEPKPAEKKPPHAPVAVAVKSISHPRADKPDQAPLAPRAVTEPSPDRSAPAVHVTIGRVEIRAVSPPAASKNGSPLPAARLSLDEYLKRTAGGKG